MPWPAAVLILAVAAIALGLAASTGATPGDPPVVEPVISPEYAVSDPGGSSTASPRAWRSMERTISSPGGGHVDGASSQRPCRPVRRSSGWPWGLRSRDGDGPSVAFDGTNYLVVWMSPDGAPEIWAARVSREDVVLDPNGIQISTRACIRGSTWEASFSTGRTTSSFGPDATDIIDYENVRGALVSPEGGVGSEIDIGPRGSSQPAVSAGNENSIVAWSG